MTVRFGARYLIQNNCDLIILMVRPIDIGMNSGGLQMRLARQSMLDAGFEIPGVKHLKRALDILKEEGIDVSAWPKESAHQDAWGDPAGDNKVEYRSPEGRSVVLKLKTSPADALMSGGKMLAHLGWRRGEPWLQEVVLPANLDWSRTGLQESHTVAEWAKTLAKP